MVAIFIVVLIIVGIPISLNFVYEIYVITECLGFEFISILIILNVGFSGVCELLGMIPNLICSLSNMSVQLQEVLL